MASKFLSVDSFEISVESIIKALISEELLCEALQSASLRLPGTITTNRDGFIRPRSFPLHQPMPLSSCDNFGLTQPP